MPYGIHRTEVAALYMKKLLSVELAEGATLDVDMPDFPLDFLQEMNYGVKLVKQALKNQSEYK